MIEPHVLQLWAEHAPDEHRKHEPEKVVSVRHGKVSKQGRVTSHPGVYDIRCSCPGKTIVEIPWIELVEDGAE